MADRLPGIDSLSLDTERHLPYLGRRQSGGDFGFWQNYGCETEPARNVEAARPVRRGAWHERSCRGGRETREMIMIDEWEVPDPYDACAKGKQAIDVDWPD